MQNGEAKKIKIVPDNFTTITPWIISPSSANVIEFLTAAFDAEEIPNSRITSQDGTIIHVVVRVGNAMVMLFDSKNDWNPTPVLLNLYVEDVEKVYRKALQLGAISVTDITALYFGEKVCRILDPFGNLWWINQRIEELDYTDPGQIQQRASTPEATEGILYIQKTLDEALKKQKEFFKDKINQEIRQD